MKRSVIYILTCSTLLSGCDSLRKEKVHLKGDRESVLMDADLLKPINSANAVPINIPTAKQNPSWEQASGNTAHAVGHLALKNDPQVAWQTNIGAGAGSESRILSEPIIAKNKAYVLNADAEVVCVNTADGDKLWSVAVTPEKFNVGSLGGGISYANDVLYVTTAYAEVLALDAITGNIIWRKNTNSPSRAAPTVVDGRVYVSTINNELEVFDTKGTKLWDNAGIVETAGLLGGASPAVHGNVVIVAYSSGEVYALNTENGQQLWNESLASFRKVDSVTSIPHISANPVIEKNNVYLISHSGRMASLDLKSGSPTWNRDIGGIKTPAVVNDVIFIVTSESQIACLSSSNGEVRWVHNLPRYVDQEKSKNKIVWNGPLLAGNKLVVTSSTGDIKLLDPKDGKELKTIEIGNGTSIAPVIANETLYILTNNGYLYALR